MDLIDIYGTFHPIAILYTRNQQQDKLQKMYEQIETEQYIFECSVTVEGIGVEIKKFSEENENEKTI
jgi:CRISPR/Cas system-associated protein Cas7 (RAMP superfamily)